MVWEYVPGGSSPGVVIWLRGWKSRPCLSEDDEEGGDSGDDEAGGDLDHRFGGRGRCPRGREACGVRAAGLAKGDRDHRGEQVTPKEHSTWVR